MRRSTRWVPRENRELAERSGRREAADSLLAEAHEVCLRLSHLGGIATVLEASALVRYDDGGAAAVRALAEASTRRNASARIRELLPHRPVYGFW